MIRLVPRFTLLALALAPAWLLGNPVPTAGAAINFSARTEFQGKPLIFGSAIQGEKVLLIRAVAAGLEKFGIDGIAANPGITVYTPAGNAAFGSIPVKLLSDENWALIETAAHASGAFPISRTSTDAVLLLPWSGPGTFHVTADADVGGEILFEIYVVPWDSYDRSTFVGVLMMQAGPPIVD